jgi:hypothetical protein
MLASVLMRYKERRRRTDVGSSSSSRIDGDDDAALEAEGESGGSVVDLDLA